MDPLDLAKLTTFYPLNEPVKYPDEALKILKVEICCLEEKLDNDGSVKSSGK